MVKTLAMTAALPIANHVLLEREHVKLATIHGNFIATPVIALRAWFI
jgi:hypothetical protein